jgi:C-terminal processing protease CtpA/Prc
MIRRILYLSVAALSTMALVSACGGGSSGSSNSGSCSVAAQNQTVYDIMQDIYLWYDQIPVVNPASYDSPEELLEAIRYLPIDRFSYIDLAEDDSAFLGEGEFIGIGFRSRTSADTVTVLDVYEGSPADNGGLVRGSSITAVDGVPIAEVLAGSDFSSALGPAEEGVTVELSFDNPDGQSLTSTFVKDVVTIPPLTAERIIDIDGQPTGYLVFRNFIQTGVPELSSLFSDFRAQGVRQVIVDLRYNTGGLVSVLSHFGNLLGGRIAPLQVLLEYEFNDKNTDQNQLVLFRVLAQSLDLERVVFITTPSSASASEMIINGLEPFVEVVTVGDVTFGKPVGQLGYIICEKILRPASFKTVNALGEGEFFDGIPVDCPAGDDPMVGFGETGEPSFDAAVYYLQNGLCPPVVASAQPRTLEKPDRPRPEYRLNDSN